MIDSAARKPVCLRLPACLPGRVLLSGGRARVSGERFRGGVKWFGCERLVGFHSARFASFSWWIKQGLYVCMYKSAAVVMAQY